MAISLKDQNVNPLHRNMLNANIDVNKFNLYIVGSDTISVADFTGLAPTVLISDSLEEPRAIALHPGAG